MSQNLSSAAVAIGALIEEIEINANAKLCQAFYRVNEFKKSNYTVQIDVIFHLSYDAKITYKSHFRRESFKIVPYKQHSIWYWRHVQSNLSNLKSYGLEILFRSIENSSHLNI